MKISLDSIKMRVITTAPNGVVNERTVFNFSQSGDVVWAEYRGGQIEIGFLVGKIQNDKLHFTYCQLQVDGVLDNGVSVGELSIDREGKIRLTEQFEWKSRPGQGGTNVFQEIIDEEVPQ